MEPDDAARNLKVEDGLSPDTQLLLAALEASNLAHTISAIDGDMPLVYVNQAFLDLTGYSRDEVIGRNCRFLVGPQTSKQASQTIRSAISQGEALAIDLVNHRKDGTPFLNHLHISPVRSASGQIQAYIGIQSDVSRLRHRLIHEQQVEHLVALGGSISRISHEIKNALQPVRLMAEVLADWRTMAEADRGRCLDVLTQGVAVAIGVADDILRSVRKGGVEGEPVPVGDLNEQAQSFVFGLLQAGITLNWSAPPESMRLRTVNIRPRHLLQVLANIAANAVDAMAGLAVRQISISWTSDLLSGRQADEIALAPGLYLRIDIVDTGSGMNAETISRLFESFVTCKPHGQGAGLGLMISRTMIREAGGTITARSVPGEGSVFTVRLPINPVA
jgi:PAS domain S-box-containing protein